MALTAQEQQDIIRKESAWIDDSFGQVDLSAFPALNELPAEDKHDDRWAKDWRDTALSASAADLRRFITDPDTEALERVGDEIGHEDFRDEVRQRRGEVVAQQFKRANPDYIPCQEAYDKIVRTLSFNSLSTSQQEMDIEDQVSALIDSGYWTVPNLTACYQALAREGLMPVPLGTARNLSDGERLRVARLAQSGCADQAIEFYLECALPDVEATVELLNDPDYREVCDSAVWTVWETITHDYTPTSQREAFLRRHCGTRPVTLPLLDAGWTELKKREANYARSEILRQFQRPQETQPVSEKQLDELSDQAVDDLYHRSLRHYAQQSCIRSLSPDQHLVVPGVIPECG